jgi:hypothetical protein
MIFVRVGGQRKCGFALQKEVKPVRALALPEEYALLGARHGFGMLDKYVEKAAIGDKSCGI